MVAHLAAVNLTSRARGAVSALLGGETEAVMAIAANWADEIRDDRPDTSSWHFVNIEIDADLHYQPARDCSGGNCVVAQILRDEAILKSTAPAPQKAEALKFLIHFLGDIHQPLHAADNHDRGGNLVSVSLRRGRPESLHHVWDDDVVAALGRDPFVVARHLDHSFSPAQKREMMTVVSPAVWAESSAAIAKLVAYPQGREGFDNRDVEKDAQVAGQQLARAGYALAGLLNRVFQ
ncbi:MAG: S1/P1 nuclease [Alphaproteobacteria bacterium]|nr:S1/P1 nuclease [Alphaproteobacteria bacterium]